MAYEGNRYANFNRKGQNEDKAGWLQPALTAAGAAGGFMVGGPAGAMAGAKLGGAAGNVTHDAINGSVTPDGLVGDVGQGVAGFNGLNKAMDTRSILEAFMRNPHAFRQGFANGGLVTGPAMDMTNQWANMDPVQRAMVQAQQAVGPAPVAPVPAQTQQASHPNWEAASGVLSQLLAALPKPANPKNTKAIGAWAPVLGVLAGAPADIAQGRRKSANAPITAANTAAQSDYEARRKAYEDRKTKIADTLVGNATKPFAETNGNRLDQLAPATTLAGLKAPAWVHTWGDLNEWQQSMAGERQGAASSAAREERAAKLTNDDEDAMALAQEIAHLRADPTISVAGRSAQYAGKVKTYVNQILAQEGSPYKGYQHLLTLWNEKSNFAKTQNQQRFTQLRQSAVTVRQHINQFKDFYRQYANRVHPKDVRLIAGGMFGAARQGLLGPDAAASAQALEVTANALATETAMVLSGGFAPQAVQVQEARQMVDKALGQRSTKAGMDALERLLEARIKNAVGATPFFGGKGNPYLIDVSPLEGWGGAAAQEPPPVATGWKPKGAKPVEGK